MWYLNVELPAGKSFSRNPFTYPLVLDILPEVPIMTLFVFVLITPEVNVNVPFMVASTLLRVMPVLLLNEKLLNITEVPLIV